MFHLDMRTIVFGHLITTAICTVVVTGLWRQNHRRFSGTDWWIVSFSLFSAATLLLFLRGTLPDFFSVVAANTMVVAGLIASFHGIALFVGRPVDQRSNLVYLAVFSMVHSYFTFVDPNLAARNINVSLAVLIISAQGSWFCVFRSTDNLRNMTRQVGLVFAGLAVIALMRILATVVIPPVSSDFFRSGTVDALILLGFQILLILLACTLALLVNRRLLAGLQFQEEKFSRAFHFSPYAMVLTRFEDGQIAEVNHGFVTLSGYSHEEVLGKSSLDLQLWARESDRDRVFATLSRGEGLHDAEFSFRRKSGELGTGLYSATIVTIDNQPCILSSIADISERKQIEEEKSLLIAELQQNLDKIKRLEGMLPICMYCKKIRDDGNHWQRLEEYIRSRSEADFSHGICPECFAREHADLARRHGIDPENPTGNGGRNGSH